jgi:hypothetical protein
MSKPVRPEDVLPAGVESGEMNGVKVRKGSVAAFVANVKQLEQLDPASADYAQVSAQIKQLVPAVRAVGVLDVFTPKTTVLAELIDSA